MIIKSFFFTIFLCTCLIFLSTVVLAKIPKHKLKPIARKSQNIPKTLLSQGLPLDLLEMLGAVRVDIIGKGNAAGHIFDLRIQNKTDEWISWNLTGIINFMPILKGFQRMKGIARKTRGRLSPHGTEVVPIDGVCVDRDRRPPLSPAINQPLAK
ncbi:MAG TPA: hypothetical protein ENI41_00385, partial [Deltaproteobacteria bacterium]|nr:hypothetical protein [Deltaproteobacteria bacterium]